jgi:hypothetical protein
LKPCLIIGEVSQSFGRCKCNRESKYAVMKSVTQVGG